MSKRDWFGNATLALGALTVLVATVATGTALLVSEYAKVHDTNAAYQQNAENDRRAAGNDIAQSCESESGDTLRLCVTDKLEAYYREQATNEDLQAQQNMAFWAAALFISSTVLTGFGLFLLGRTLLYTRQAAEHAGAAVVVTREIGEAQARAYLTVTKASIEAGKGSGINGYPRLTLRGHNSGVTPAVNVSYFCQASLSKQFFRNVIPTLPTKIPFDRYIGDFPSGVERPFDGMAFGIAIAIRDFETAMESTDPAVTPMGEYPLIVLHGVIFYEDVFGKTYRSMFGFLMDGWETNSHLDVIQAPVVTFEKIFSRSMYMESRDQGD